jgi:hypothetical protein
MNLIGFEKYIKTVSKEELDSIFESEFARLKRARTPESQYGISLALGMIQIEYNMRKPHPPCELSDDELLAELTN